MNYHTLLSTFECSSFDSVYNWVDIPTSLLQDPILSCKGMGCTEPRGPHKCRTSTEFLHVSINHSAGVFRWLKMATVKGVLRWISARVNKSDRWILTTRISGISIMSQLKLSLVKGLNSSWIIAVVNLRQGQRSCQKLQRFIHSKCFSFGESMQSSLPWPSDWGTSDRQFCPHVVVVGWRNCRWEIPSSPAQSWACLCVQTLTQ